MGHVRAHRSGGSLAAKSTVPAFAFDQSGHDQMKRMVLDWVDVKSPNMQAPHVEVVLDADMNRDSFRDAFAMVRLVKPPLALWLVVFKDGDSHHILPQLGEFFKETRHYTRHGVFHWSPERCDNKQATFNATRRAYKYAGFVFQFGYQDDRLADLEPEKFMPWPLGPAWWRGWQPPESVLPPSNRSILASFRGASSSADRREAFVTMGPLASRKEHVVIEDSGNWTDALPTEQVSRYKELLAQSKYSISVVGHHPNCYRIFESVLSGAIPILFREPAGSCNRDWLALYGHPGRTNYSWIPRAPFEVLEDIHELPQALANFASAERKLKPTKEANTATMDASSNSTAAGDDRGVALMLWYEKWRKAFRDKLIESMEAQLGGARWNKIRGFSKYFPRNFPGEARA